MTKHAKDYYTSHMETFESFEAYGGAPSMKIMPKLVGKPWDDYALGALHAVNPTCIRVTDGCIKCNSRIGRVTVIVDENNIIKNVSMEVMVGLPIFSVEESKDHMRMDEIHEQVSDLIEDGEFWGEDD